MAKAIQRGGYVLDFYCPSARLAVEFGGAVHDGPVRQVADAEREGFLTARGIRVLRFENRQVFEQPDVVAEALRIAVGQRSEGQYGFPATMSV